LKELLYIAGGAVLGFAIATRLRPHQSSTCAKRVAEGFRNELGAKCGPLGFLCQGVGDFLGVTDAGTANSFLDAVGL
jgi:hypothetical protein